MMRREEEEEDDDTHIDVISVRATVLSRYVLLRARRQPVGTEHCTELHVEDAELGRNSRTHRILNMQSL